MFSVSIQFLHNDPQKVLRGLQWKEANGTFFQSLDFTKKLLTVTIKSNIIEGSFAQNLAFKEYKAVHDWLVELARELNGDIQDSNSQLGYLSDQTPAYIVTNWEKWETFLLTAKLKSLEGKKVMVLDEEERILEEGLLVEYTTAANSPFMKISACTVITLFGERKINGGNLKIEAVYE